MNEKPIYLKSLHHYNFRHNEENPIVIGFVDYTPSNLVTRPCFKVKYESDGQIDYVSYKSLINGEWKFIK